MQCVSLCVFVPFSLASRRSSAASVILAPQKLGLALRRIIVVRLIMAIDRTCMLCIL